MENINFGILTEIITYSITLMFGYTLIIVKEGREEIPPAVIDLLKLWVFFFFPFGRCNNQILMVLTGFLVRKVRKLSLLLEFIYIYIVVFV